MLGYGGFGMLGTGDIENRGDEAGEMGDSLPAVDLGTGKTAIAVSAGTGYTCALLTEGTVKCWGFNVQGQLGLGDTENRGNDAGEMGDSLPAVNLGTGKTAIALAAGATHTFALLSEGTVKCWGASSSPQGAGQLGLGDTESRGDEAGEM